MESGELQILTTASLTRGAEPEDIKAAAAPSAMMPFLRTVRGGQGQGGRKGEEEGEDVFRCGSCDEKSGKRLETRGGEEGKAGGEVVEDCALFIPADTSVCVIHLEKGISQQDPPDPHV